MCRCSFPVLVRAGVVELTVVGEGGREGEMGRPPCCDKANVKKGPWTAEEDAKLLAYTSTHGTGNWTSVPQRAGLKRCGKSCRLRYTNYLRPNLKHENFTQEEEELIVTLHAMLGSRWSLIANQLPGRTDNDVKNYWNTKLSKKLRQRGIDPITHRPIADLMQSIGTLAIRPPPAAASYLPASPAASDAPPACLPVFHDAPYFTALPQQQQQQQVVTHVDADAPASPDQQHLQLNWSDFLADDATGAALAGHADALAPQAALGQYQEGSKTATTGAGCGGRAFGDVDGTSGGVCGEDDGAGAASAFIDAILDCDKEMGVDQLIAEMLADPAYYAGGSSSSELGWGFVLSRAASAAKAAARSPLRRWKPFLAAFSSVDDAIEAADQGGRSRDEFRRARGRVVEMLCGAEGDGEAEGLCVVLDEVMAESLTTLRIVPVEPKTLGTTDLAKAVGAMRKHESERIRGLATDIVRGWKAAVRRDPVKHAPPAPKKKATADGSDRINTAKTSEPSLPKTNAPVVGGARVKTAYMDAEAKPKESEHPQKRLPAVIGSAGGRRDDIKSYHGDDEKLMAATKRKVHQEAEETNKRRKTADMRAATKPKESALPPKKLPPVVASAGRRESIKLCNEDEKIAAAKRKLHEGYQEAEEAKKRRNIHVIEDPKMVKQRQQKMHPILRVRSQASRATSMAEESFLMSSLRRI
ncbi:hypothetical protein E2562_014501 [Oryza meyeriana var. granulata]|uniref:TFIIS N-terminal domain-containing protein n=1 Tax=Oryza meyeriana var. granulata TaxID=110450 RepID=A0A6G1CQB0_9ORYZ|nr:hypothetical protein E2562_014501 [Oryza meyeriana var. granulata]